MATNETRPSTFNAGFGDDSLFHRARRRSQRFVLPVLGVLVTLLLWYAGTNWFGSAMIRRFSPTASFQTLGELLSDTSFYRHIYTSLYRLSIALMLCVGAGLPVGLLVGYFKWFEQSTILVFQFLRMISPLAWFPIALILFGVGSYSAIFVMVMAGVWPMVLNTAHGVMTIQQEWLEVGRSLGGNTPGLLRKIVIPAVVPDILNGLRLSIGITWIILVPAEMLGVNSGLGYYILDARDRFAYSEIPAVIIVIGCIGFLLDFVVRKLQSRWNWQQFS